MFRYILTAPFYFFLSLILTVQAHAFLPLSGQTKLTWNRSIEKTEKNAKSKKLPMLLFFKGSDWCNWCDKFDKEIFSDPDFIKQMGKKILFVEVDFPSKEHQEKELVQQNESLKKKYDITGFPSLVLLDAQGEVITELGYLPVKGKAYADHIEEILNSYASLTKALGVPHDNFGLEKLFEKSRHLGAKHLTDQIYQKGLKEHTGAYFLIEKYCRLIERSPSDEASIKETRAEIERRDPQNILGDLYRVALLDFQYAVQNQKEVHQTVEPLISYIERFKEQDQKRIWKVEMMVSQYLFSKGELDLALKHARSSYKIAPEAIRKEIAESIQYIRSEMRKKR